MARRRGRTDSRTHTRAARADPFSVLGLRGDATVDEIEAARKALARSRHPDVGGSVVEMQRINVAADEAIALAAGSGPQTVPPAPSTTAPPRSAAPAMLWRFDHPSFTVEALPAATFEALLVVATWLGESIDDDPPYRLDVEITDPVPAWCRLDLVPDAGATTVSLSVGVDRDAGEPDLDRIRDAWISGLNSLDWAEIGGSPRQP